MASSDDAEWYLAGSGVPVGWNEGAVGFRVVPLAAAAVSLWIAPGAMVVVVVLVVGGCKRRGADDQGGGRSRRRDGFVRRKAKEREREREKWPSSGGDGSFLFSYLVVPRVP